MGDTDRVARGSLLMWLNLCPMDPTIILPFLEPIAGSIVAGIVATGKWARGKLATSKKKKALEACSLAGLEALVREGIQGRMDRVDHIRDVLETFFALDALHLELKKFLRGQNVEASSLAILFAEECDPDGIPEFDPTAGFAAFLEAFEGRAMEEEALQKPLELMLKKKEVAALERGAQAQEQTAAAQEETARTFREQPERTAEAQRRAREKEKADQATAAERAYLESMRREWRLLPLEPLGGRDGPKQSVTLDDVYVELDTTTQVRAEGKAADDGPSAEEMPDEPQSYRPDKSRPLSALEAAGSHQHMILLGVPGSGKSTFVRELLARFASARLGDGEVPEGFDEAPLPVLIVLRELAVRLTGLDLPKPGSRKRVLALARAVREHAVAALDDLEVVGFGEALVAFLKDGACLIAFDGLDEVPPEYRPLIREAVLATCQDHAPERVLVTCRVRSYTGAAQLPGFEPFTLAPFSHAQIQRFCVGWYQAQGGPAREADEQGQDLARAALGQLALARNPMLLTTMALVHQQNMELPKERVRLYDKAVTLLLVRWQKRKGTEGLQRFLSDEQKLRGALELLAFKAHEVGGGAQESAAELRRRFCAELLEADAWLGSLDAASQFLDYVDQRAGLLVGHGGAEGKPESYSFPHRTFQEYLAGCYLVGQREVVRVFYTRAGEGDVWSLAAELGAEELYHVRRNPHGLLDLAYGLCPAGEPVTEQEQRVALWSGKAAAVVGREVIERDTEGPEPGKAYLERLIPRLVDLLASDLPPVERAEAGRALAVLGDPRSGVMTVLGMEMCRVPAGAFWWGKEGKAKKREVAYPYWMSRFPVTQAQYREFAEAGGYREARYWVEAKAAGVWDEGQVTDVWEGVSVDGPQQYGGRFSLGNHPIVGVTWYEALAFTRWLTDRLHQEGMAEDWAVQLPSELEWEKAARGGLEVPVASSGFESLRDLVHHSGGLGGSAVELEENTSPKRKYPWVEEPTPDHANSDDTGIGSTSAVGAFPRGRSPYGCEELSGNVDEWSRDFWSGEATDRDARPVLRGGSWAYPAQNLAAAFRDWVRAGSRYLNVGFRVVLVRVSEHA